jgi:hypothetical protein
MARIVDFKIRDGICFAGNTFMKTFPHLKTDNNGRYHNPEGMKVL